MMLGLCGRSYWAHVRGFRHGDGSEERCTKSGVHKAAESMR